MRDLRHDRYLVTGGAGFIGSHICEAIVRQGKEVVCLDDLVAGHKENLEEWWDSDLCTFVERDVATLTGEEDFLEGVDVIFHNAASKCTVCTVDPLKDLMTNAYGTLRVSLAGVANGVQKVVHASTGSVREGKPVSYYGVSKLTGENYLRAVREYHPSFSYSILRYYHVYGPRQAWHDRGGVIPIFIRNVWVGEPITVFGDGLQVRHFTHVEDVVDANFLAANDDSFGSDPVDVVSDVTVSISDLAQMVVRLSSGEPVPTRHEEARKGDIRCFGVGNDAIRAKGKTEFLSDFEVGLTRTVEWYEERFSTKGIECPTS